MVNGTYLRYHMLSILSIAKRVMLENKLFGQDYLWIPSFFQGLQIQTTDSSTLSVGRLRVQIHENLDIIVSVNNERNLASLTISGDIENHDHIGNHSKSHETYITPGVVRISSSF
jgi:hypothetical protein